MSTMSAYCKFGARDCRLPLRYAGEHETTNLAQAPAPCDKAARSEAPATAESELSELS
jgi:hypothetical protein